MSHHYAFVIRHFGVQAAMRSRVRHTATGKEGEIVPPLPHLNSYVRVKFDGEPIGTNCAPMELEYGLMPTEFKLK